MAPYLPHLMERMRRRVPEFHFSLVSARIDEIARLLRNNQLDIGLASADETVGDQWDCRVIFRLPCVLLVKDDSPIKEAAEILERDRIDLPLIALPKNEPACRISKRNCKRAASTGIRPTNSQVLNSSPAMWPQVLESASLWISVSNTIRIVPGSLPAFLRGSLFAACLALVPGLSAQNDLLNDFLKRPEIEKRLAAVRSEISALPAGADTALRERLQQLEALCQFHLSATDDAAKAQGERENAAQATTAWRAFPQPPPHSILLLDGVHETLAMLANSQRAGEAQLRIFAAEIEAARDKLQGYQQAEPRFMEAAVVAATPEACQSAEVSLKIERDASRIAAEEIARVILRREDQQAELDMIRSKVDLSELQLKSLEGKTVFPQSDLAAIHQRIAAERAETVKSLMDASQHQQSPNPLLAWKIEFLDLEKNFWDMRFAAGAKKDSTTRKAALATLAEFKFRVDGWAEIAQFRLVGGSVSATEIDPAHGTAYMGITCSNCGSDKVIRAGVCGICTQCGTSQGCS